MKINQTNLDNFNKAYSYLNKPFYKVPIDDILNNKVNQRYYQKLTGLQKTYFSKVTSD